MRMDYLHSQLATLREQFAQLGHLAGITCGFDPERPRSNNILIAAVAEKEAANESQLSYLDEMRRSGEGLVVAIAALEAEEESLKAFFVCSCSFVCFCFHYRFCTFRTLSKQRSWRTMQG